RCLCRSPAGNRAPELRRQRRATLLRHAFDPATAKPNPPLQASLWLPGCSYLVSLRARGQLEADAPVIILLRRRLQVKLGQRDFAIVARREVIERLAHYRVILNLR